MGFVNKDKRSRLGDSFELGDYVVDFSSNKSERVRVVFMGTPSFAVPILEGLIENYDVVMVVCQPDKKKSRKGELLYPETKRVALEYKKEIFQPISIRDEYERIIEAKPDLIVTCAYGQIIPKALIDYPKYGCINVHGSLLPKLRGGAPIHWAIINGEKETGITIMAMSPRMDAGDIIKQKSLEIGENEILDSLYQRMSILGRDLLLETLPSIIDGTCSFEKQDEELVTFGFNITREDEKIDFQARGVAIRNLVRGLNSQPGAYCYLDDKRMKIYDVEIADYSGKVDGVNGEIVGVLKDGMICKCQDGYLKIKEIGIEGKKRCMVQDFFNGIDKMSLLGKVLR